MPDGFSEQKYGEEGTNANYERRLLHRNKIKKEQQQAC